MLLHFPNQEFEGMLRFLNVSTFMLCISYFHIFHPVLAACPFPGTQGFCQRCAPEGNMISIELGPISGQSDLPGSDRELSMTCLTPA